MTVIKVWMIIALMLYVLWTWYAWKYRKYIKQIHFGSIFQDIVTISWLGVHAVIIAVILCVWLGEPVTKLLNYQIYP